jgi:uncharacterized RmlC-like cupin family protein
MTDLDDNWRSNGVRIVRQEQFDPNPARWTGVQMDGAITFANTRARKIWAGRIRIEPNAKTGAHHHGELESIIYVVSGKARLRWGEHLEYYAEAGPGDFIFVPPFIPHQEINASSDEPLIGVMIRNDQKPVVISLEIDSPEQPELVKWVDPHHPRGAA